MGAPPKEGGWGVAEIPAAPCTSLFIYPMKTGLKLKYYENLKKYLLERFPIKLQSYKISNNKPYHLQNRIKYYTI